ncbi:predicted protein [Naegleria gruberi]|uniref:Predicted protein n=1 Tax=Naegleria gruberi TaxID=5762 RepID=D2W445_NAEGR|nr:uncharacterized protein NAEGRDRAFT_76175 [Naegleria gruberi]EFC36147.1 predicted protein [Naegleria gruberi]|eukprot:XP_002668891.1 predicted protein [Naegleria gruberi strain NEG-M]
MSEQYVTITEENGNEALVSLTEAIDKLPTHLSFFIHIPRETQVKRNIRALAVHADVYGEVSRIYCSPPSAEIQGDSSFIKVVCFSRSRRKIKTFLMLLYNSWIADYPIEFCVKEPATFGHHRFNIVKESRQDNSVTLTEDIITIPSIEQSHSCNDKPLSFYKRTWGGKGNISRHSSWEAIKRYTSNVEALLDYLSEPLTSSSEGLSESSKEFKYTKTKQKRKERAQNNTSIRVANIESKLQLMKLQLEEQTKIEGTLQKATGFLEISEFKLDKSKPKSWRREQMRMVLIDYDVGVGINEEDLQSKIVSGFDLENVVDTLIFFKGEKEEKIEHACTRNR